MLQDTDATQTEGLQAGLSMYTKILIALFSISLKLGNTYQIKRRDILDQQVVDKACYLKMNNKFDFLTRIYAALNEFKSQVNPINLKGAI